MPTFLCDHRVGLAMCEMICSHLGLSLEIDILAFLWLSKKYLPKLMFSTKVKYNETLGPLIRTGLVK